MYDLILMYWDLSVVIFNRMDCMIFINVVWNKFEKSKLCQLFLDFHSSIFRTGVLAHDYLLSIWTIFINVAPGMCHASTNYRYLVSRTLVTLQQQQRLADIPPHWSGYFQCNIIVTLLPWRTPEQGQNHGHKIQEGVVSCISMWRVR